MFATIVLRRPKTDLGFILLVWLALAASHTLAAELAANGIANENRARINYMLNCQGCHGPDAQGSEAADVPRMKNYVGHFLRVPGGREYLVQVPGSANAAVNDAQLAELLNWILLTMSPEQIPASFVPYSEAEVKTLRYSPEEDVIGTRQTLVESINAIDR